MRPLNRKVEIIYSGRTARASAQLETQQNASLFLWYLCVIFGFETKKREFYFGFETKNYKFYFGFETKSMEKVCAIQI